jgi:hypothetical protein
MTASGKLTAVFYGTKSFLQCSQELAENNFKKTCDTLLNFSFLLPSPVGFYDLV